MTFLLQNHSSIYHTKSKYKNIPTIHNNPIIKRLSYPPIISYLYTSYKNLYLHFCQIRYYTYRIYTLIGHHSRAQNNILFREQYLISCVLRYRPIYLHSLNVPLVPAMILLRVEFIFLVCLLIFTNYHNIF